MKRQRLILSKPIIEARELSKNIEHNHISAISPYQFDHMILAAVRLDIRNHDKGSPTPTQIISSNFRTQTNAITVETCSIQLKNAPYTPHASRNEASELSNLSTLPT